MTYWKSQQRKTNWLDVAIAILIVGLWAYIIIKIGLMI